jgi:DNA replication protein DnaC
VQRHENIFVIGPTGVEKSFLASALAQKACRDGHLVLYIRAAALFRDLALARADGSLRNLLARLSRVDVLVIDILDRLVHNAHRIELRGESLRKNRSKKSESASPPAA